MFCFSRLFNGILSTGSFKLRLYFLYTLVLHDLLGLLNLVFFINCNVSFLGGVCFVF